MHLTHTTTDTIFRALTEHMHSPFVQEGPTHYLRYDAVSVHHNPATRGGVLLRLWWRGTEVCTFSRDGQTGGMPGAVCTVAMEGRIPVTLE